MHDHYRQHRLTNLFPSSRIKVILLVQTIQLMLLVTATLIDYAVREDRSLASTPAVPIVVIAFAFALQWIYLLPVLKPQAKTGQPVPWRAWVGSLAAGAATGILTVAGLLILADGLFAIGALGEIYRDSLRASMPLAIFVSWAVFTPLVYLFMRRPDYERWYRKYSCCLFLGTVVEILASIPILQLVRRHDGCESNSGSLIGRVLAVAVGIVLLGPVISLLVLQRRSRASHRGRCPACGNELRVNTNRDQCDSCKIGWRTQSDERRTD